MNSETAQLERHIKKATIWSNLISMAAAIVAACIVVYAFYYDTSKTLDKHTRDINEVIIEVNQINTKLNDNDVFQGVSKIEIESLKKQVGNVEHKVDRIDEKLDKILFQTRE